MESSFLTFSPKALTKRKPSSSTVLKSTKPWLLKSKTGPLRDICSTSSNAHNIKKSESVSFGNKKDDSDVIVLDDSVVVLSDNCKTVKNSTCTPVLSNDRQMCNEKQKSLSSKYALNKPPQNSFSPNDKFDEIRQWLDELHNAHEEKRRSSSPWNYITSSNINVNSMWVPKPKEKSSLNWRVPETSSEESERSLAQSRNISSNPNSCASKSEERFFSNRIVPESNSEESAKSFEQSRTYFGLNLNSGASKVEEKSFSNWRAVESSSDKSVRLSGRRKGIVLSSDSEAGGDASDQSDSSAVKSVTSFTSANDLAKAASSSSNDCETTPNNVSQSRKRYNFKCSRTSITSDESVISAISADKILSEMYGTTWNKKSVLTPKARTRKSTDKKVLHDDSSTIHLLSQLYGNSWDKKKVLTPIVNRTKAKEVKGKENTPPATQNKTKVGTFNSKPVVFKTITKCTPTSSRSTTKTKSQETLSFLRSLSASPPSSQCNLKALLYKNEFQKNKEALCFELFKLFNSEVFENKLPSTLKIDWNIRMNRTAGFCRNSWVQHPEGKVRSSRIELSTKVCSSANRVRDTLIHELCHAATWIVDGVKNGHGALWKAWTRKAMRKFPELPLIGRCHSYNIETKYSYKCKKCGYSIGRHSKSLDLQRKRCGYCYGEFELLVNVKSKRADPHSTATPRTPRTAVGFALYVKENYRMMKEKNTGLKHAEIMKLLGNQFSGMKVGNTE